MGSGNLNIPPSLQLKSMPSFRNHASEGGGLGLCLRICGVGLEFWGLGCWAEGLDLGFWAQNWELRFEVWGFGFRLGVGEFKGLGFKDLRV